MLWSCLSRAEEETINFINKVGLEPDLGGAKIRPVSKDWEAR
jgi:hypothetical protein